MLSSWTALLLLALFSVCIHGATLTVSPTSSGVLGVSPYNTIVANCTLKAEPGSNITEVDFQWTESRTSSTLPAFVHAFSATTTDTLSGNSSVSTAASSATISFNNIFSPGIISYYYFTCSVTANITNTVNGGETSESFTSIGKIQLGVRGPLQPATPKIGEVTPSPHSVVIRWIVSSVSYTPETYTVHYGIDSAILNLTSDTLGTDVKTDFLNIKDQDYRLVIAGLQPAQKYYYSVVSTNSLASRKTAKQSFTTTDSVPGPPSNLQLISTPFSPSLLFLSWGEPTLTNGIITGYEYYCYHNMDHSDIVQEQVVGSNIRGVSIDGDGSGLQPSTSYVCEVTAATVEGNGAAASITEETGSSEIATAAASITEETGSSIQDSDTSVSEESHCVLEMVVSTVIIFIITFIIILIANVLITYLFIRHQKKKFIEQAQAIGEAIPEGERSQGEQNQTEQFANNVKIPANAFLLPYYDTVRTNNQTQTRNVHLESNPAYM